MSESSSRPDLETGRLLFVEGNQLFQPQMLIVGIFVSPHGILQRAAVYLDAEVIRGAFERTLRGHRRALEPIHFDVGARKVITRRAAVLLDLNNRRGVGDDLTVHRDLHTLAQRALHDAVVRQLLMSRRLAHKCRISAGTSIQLLLRPSEIRTGAAASSAISTSSNDMTWT